MEKQIGNVGRRMKILWKNEMEMPEIKNIIK